MISYVRTSGSSKVSNAVVDLEEPLLILGKKSQREAGRTTPPPPSLLSLMSGFVTVRRVGLAFALFGEGNGERAWD